jgi:hypothetical protein
MPKWLKSALKWAGKTLLNAAVEKGEQLIDEKKAARTARPKRPKN